MARTALDLLRATDCSRTVGREERSTAPRWRAEDRIGLNTKAKRPRQGPFEKAFQLRTLPLPVNLLQSVGARASAIRVARTNGAAAGKILSQGRIDASVLALRDIASLSRE